MKIGNKKTCSQNNLESYRNAYFKDSKTLVNLHNKQQSKVV